MRENLNFNRMLYFVAIVEEGTITAAAKRLGISKAVVSKQLLLLEEELGTSLVWRNTRHLHANEAGLKFYEQCKAAITQAKEAYRTVKPGGEYPSGKIRVTASLDFGTLFVAPLAAKFIQENKEVEIDLHLTDDRLDPVKMQFDLAFRVGWLSDSSNLSRKVGDFEEWLVCSSKLAEAPNVKHPTDMKSLPFIGNAALSDLTSWRFTKGADLIELKPQNVLMLNAGTAILEAVCAGGACAILPDFVARQAVNSGVLCRLLPNWSLRKGGIYSVTPPTRFQPVAIRQFVDFVTRHHRKSQVRS
jgi:DNA-binding transcriptional LysR family regulator